MDWTRRLEAFETTPGITAFSTLPPAEDFATTSGSTAFSTLQPADQRIPLALKNLWQAYKDKPDINLYVMVQSEVAKIRVDMPSSYLTSSEAWKPPPGITQHKRRPVVAAQPATSKRVCTQASSPIATATATATAGTPILFEPEHDLLSPNYIFDLAPQPQQQLVSSGQTQSSVSELPISPDDTAPTPGKPTAGTSARVVIAKFSCPSNVYYEHEHEKCICEFTDHQSARVHCTTYHRTLPVRAPACHCHKYNFPDACRQPGCVWFWRTAPTPGTVTNNPLIDAAPFASEIRINRSFAIASRRSLPFGHQVCDFNVPDSHTKSAYNFYHSLYMSAL